MLTKLILIQRRENLTDREMASRLGVARPTWNRVKNGHLALTDEVAVRAAGLWPELTRELIERAASTVSARTDSASNPEAAA